MQRRTTAWLVTILVAVVLAGTTTGCTDWLLGSNVASFGAGWLLRHTTMPTTTETLCYRNGEPIDCSEAQ